MAPKRPSEDSLGHLPNKRQCSQTSAPPSHSPVSPGPAPDTPPNPDMAALEDQLKTLAAELERSRSVANAQAELLDSVRTSLRCNICLDTLDSPYTLRCGHIFCYKDLYDHFHRLPPTPDHDSEAYDSDESDDFPIHGSSAPARLPSSNRVDALAAADPEAGPSSSTANNPGPARPVPRLSSHQRKQNLICPECRAQVHSPPFPLYAVKAAADSLRNAESITDKDGQEDMVSLKSEVHRDERDKTWGNVFLNDRSPGTGAAIRDVADGVRRCTHCAWEITHEGTCDQCGAMYSSEEDSDVDDEDDRNSDASFDRRDFLRQFTRSYARGLDDGFPVEGEDNIYLASSALEDSDHPGSSAYSDSSDDGSSSEGSDLPVARRRANGGRRVIESDGSGASDDSDGSEGWAGLEEGGSDRSDQSDAGSARHSDRQSSEPSDNDDQRTVGYRSDSGCEKSDNESDEDDESSTVHQQSDFDSGTDRHSFRKSGGPRVVSRDREMSSDSDD